MLCADGHLGYSMPIGGVVGYHSFISPSGVGYDIACGNLAAKTNLRAAEIDDWTRLATQIQRRNQLRHRPQQQRPVPDHPVFDRIVVEGVNSAASNAARYSTVHGAGA